MQLQFRTVIVLSVWWFLVLISDLKAEIHPTSTVSNETIRITDNLSVIESTLPNYANASDENSNFTTSSPNITFENTHNSSLVTTITESFVTTYEIVSDENPLYGTSKPVTGLPEIDTSIEDMVNTRETEKSIAEAEESTVISTKPTTTSINTTSSAPTTVNPCVNTLSKGVIHLLTGSNTTNKENPIIIIKAVIGNSTMPSSEILTPFASFSPFFNISQPTRYEYSKEDKIHLNASEDFMNQSFLCSSVENFTWFISVNIHFEIQCTLHNLSLLTENEFLIFGAGEHVLQESKSLLFFGETKNKTIRLVRNRGHIFFSFNQEEITDDSINTTLFTISCEAERISYPSANITIPEVIPRPPKNATINICLINLDLNKTQEFLKSNSDFREEFVELIKNETLDWPQLEIENKSEISVSVVINPNLTVHPPFLGNPCRYCTDPTLPYCVCFDIGIVVVNLTTDTIIIFNEAQLQKIFGQIIARGSFTKYRIRISYHNPDYFLYIAIPIGIVGLFIIIFYSIWRAADWNFWNRKKESDPPDKFRIPPTYKDNPAFNENLVPGWYENQKRDSVIPNGAAAFGLDSSEEDSFVNPFKSPLDDLSFTQLQRLQNLRINPLRKTSRDESDFSPLTPIPPYRKSNEKPVSPLTKSLQDTRRSSTIALQLTPKSSPLNSKKEPPLALSDQNAAKASPKSSPLTPTRQTPNSPRFPIVSNPITPGSPLKSILSRKLSTPESSLLNSEGSPSPKLTHRKTRFSLAPNLIDLRDSTILEEDEDTDL